MKREDLMIGDWVLLTDLDYGVRVECLCLTDMFWRSGEEAISKTPYEKVEPLYLHQDILRDNGFELVEVGDHGAATPAQYRDRFEKWMARTKWRDIVIWYDRRTETYNLKDMGAAKIKYIHELQHALKLSGIEKDIEL